jgi:DNA-binding response OmpR family regulator
MIQTEPMLSSSMGMPTVFVIAPDWTLRTTLRAELREQAIDALGMNSPDQAGQALAAGTMPAALVIEAIPEITGDPALRRLIERVPTILIVSRTATVPLPPVDTVLYRPVQIGEIAGRVKELVQRGHAV